MIGNAEIPERSSSAAIVALPLVGLLGAIGLAALLAQGLSTQSTAVLAAGALIAIVLGAICTRAMQAERAAERLVMAYIFLSPFQFSILGSSLFPADQEGFGVRVSLSDLILPLLLLVLLRQRVRGTSVVRSREALVFIGLGLAIAASWGQSILHLGGITTYSSVKAIGLIALVIAAAAIVEVVRERKLWDRALDAVAFSGLASGAIGIVGFLFWRLGGVDSYLMDHDRLNSTMFTDPNIFGSLMAVSVIIAVVRISLTSSRARLFWVTVLLVTLVALALSQSRSGIICCAGGLFVLAILARPSAVLAGSAALILLGVIAFAAYSPLGEPGTDSVLVDRRLSDTTLVSRLDLWSDGLALLPEEAASGIGIGGFEQTTFDTTSGRKEFARVHNTYLTIIVEFGLVGVVAFSLLAVAVAKSVRSGFIVGSRDQRWRIAAVIACVVGLLAFSVWVDTLYQRHLWILIGLALAAPQRNESDVESVVPVDGRNERR